MPRTAPPPIPKVLVAKKGDNGAVILLSPQEIAQLQQKYAPPLTPLERAEKQEREAAIPDMSHLTVWDPSRR